jgi:hypothetical protein
MLPKEHNLKVTIGLQQFVHIFIFIFIFIFAHISYLQEPTCSERRAVISLDLEPSPAFSLVLAYQYFSEHWWNEIHVNINVSCSSLALISRSYLYSEFVFSK